MNNEHDEGDKQSGSDDFGNDPDVPIVHVPPPEHPHNPAKVAQHSQHYIKRSAEFICEHWPSANTWSAFGSLVTALATIVMVVVYFQIKGIMYSQGGQTDKLIDAANVQARASRKIALAARIQGRAASSFAESADRMDQHTDDAAKSMAESAKAAERAIAEGRNQFRIFLRPWIGLSDDPDSFATGPIEFNAQGMGIVKYRMTVKNFGAQAAQDVGIYGGFYLGEGSSLVPKWQRELCSQYPSEGYLLFPGKAHVTEWSTALGDKSPAGIKEGHAFLVVCVAYRDQFRCPYVTPYTYRFDDVQGRQPFIVGAIPETHMDMYPGYQEFLLFSSAIAPNATNESQKTPQTSLGDPCPK